MDEELKETCDQYTEKGINADENQTTKFFDSNKHWLKPTWNQVDLITKNL